MNLNLNFFNKKKALIKNCLKISLPCNFSCTHLVQLCSVKLSAKIHFPCHCLKIFLN